MQRKSAGRQSNRSVVDSLAPTGFSPADENYSANMVWRQQAAGATQQAIAQEIGWSREAVCNYTSLAKIGPRAWAIIGTTFALGATAPADDVVPSPGTVVPISSERLLSDIVALTPDQQLELAALTANHSPPGRPG